MAPAVAVDHAVPNVGRTEGDSVTDVQHEVTSSAPAAGWYPDPAQPGRTRWWSGDGWTDHVQPAAVPVAPVPPAAPTPSNLDENGVPLNLFADTAFTPAVLAPAAGPTTQSEWHTQSGRGPRPTRAVAGSVSLSTQVPTAASRRHDPYRERNWIAGVALLLAILSAPALFLSVAWDLPAVTRGVFGGAPIAIALLAVVTSVRRGTGVVVSIVAVLIAGAVLLAGFVVDPQVFRELVANVTTWLGL